MFITDIEKKETKRMKIINQYFNANHANFALALEIKQKRK